MVDRILRSNDNYNEPVLKEEKKSSFLQLHILNIFLGEVSGEGYDEEWYSVFAI